jgi:CRISPR associated protein Cas1
MIGLAAQAEAARTPAVSQGWPGMGIVRPTPAASRGALYLGRKGAVRLDVDGAAFLVKGTGLAAARYPFTRVARIVAMEGRVELSARAMCAATRTGIPVIFLDASGRVTGNLVPAAPSQSSPDQIIDDFLNRPDWEEHYGNWLRAVKMRVLAQWRHGRARRGEAVDLGYYEACKRRYVYGIEQDHGFEGDQAILFGAVSALVVERLSRRGLRGRYWGFDGKSLELAADLSGVLQLSLRLEMDGLAGRAQGEMPVWLRVFQTHAETLCRELDALAGRLLKRLSILMEEWD